MSMTPARTSRTEQGQLSIKKKIQQPFLKKALANKGATLSMFIGAFILILSMIMSGWTKFVFFPRIPSETVRMNLTMTTGTPFEVTRLSYLIAQPRLQKVDGSWISFDDTYALINAHERDGRVVLEHVPKGEYQAVEWWLGLLYKSRLGKQWSAALSSRCGHGGGEKHRAGRSHVEEDVGEQSGVER